MSVEKFTSEQRVLAPYHHIDPGFINHRLVLSSFGPRFREYFESHRRSGEDHLTKLANDHLLVTMALDACRQASVPSIGQLLADPKEGQLFCSTEEIVGTKDVYDASRVSIPLNLPYPSDRTLTLEFHTFHFVADTGKVELSQRSKVSIVGAVHKIDGQNTILRPLIMGAPSYDHPRNKNIGVDLMWYGWDWYEVYCHDIAEFRKAESVTNISADEWINAMKNLSEEQIKHFICEILGDAPRKDWAGEQGDHLAASLHLGSKRVTAAFAFKGPAQFREMTPDMLGKRADQIYRLACTPAGLLVVQHCHQIGEAVRATLRAFAVTPHNPRSYCLIDGKDTYRILKAYGKI